jgi:cytochrome P450
MAVSLSSSLPLPPGARCVPWIGETIAWVRDPLAFAQQRYERYGLVWRTHLMGRPCAVLLGPDANRFILSTHLHLFSSRAGWGKPITSLIGDGLSLIDGAEHRRHRRMIQPALHGAMLGRYFEVMLQLTVAHTLAWARRGTLKLFDGFKHLSFDIAARLLLGARNESEARRFYAQFHRFTSGLFAPPALRLPGTPYRKAWYAGQSLRRTLRAVIDERRADDAGDDMLGLLLQAQDEQGNRFTTAELIDELLVLLWAGHDTITSLLTWTLYELLRHPAVYARVLDEQMTVVGDEPLALAQLKQMPLLDHVLREAERLHPPAPGGFRGVVTPFEYGGYRIPAGWTVMYSSVWTHHMPDLWYEPLRFDPDRFGPPREEGKKPFQLIGFGGGPRVCVGLAFAQMQMRIIVSHLLRTYRLTLLPGQDFRPVPVPTKMPKDGLVVGVENREQRTENREQRTENRE